MDLHAHKTRFNTVQNSSTLLRKSQVFFSPAKSVSWSLADTGSFRGLVSSSWLTLKLLSGRGWQAQHSPMSVGVLHSIALGNTIQSKEGWKHVHVLPWYLDGNSPFAVPYHIKNSPNIVCILIAI